MSAQVKTGLLLLWSCLAAILMLLGHVEGHGRMLEPAGRSSRWRFDKSAPANYDDHGLNCGGFGTQWSFEGGRCGMCGDSYKDAPPRPNELGGKYGGSGVIVRDYTAGSVITVRVEITVNHLGTIFFHLCNLDANNGMETEDCYLTRPLRYADGSERFGIGSTRGMIERQLVLPADVQCEHCVLRWTYRAGNNWGACENGGGALGCGNQEHFMSCADVRIKRAGRFAESRAAAVAVEEKEEEEVEVPAVV